MAVHDDAVERSAPAPVSAAAVAGSGREDGGGGHCRLEQVLHFLAGTSISEMSSAPCAGGARHILADALSCTCTRRSKFDAPHDHVAARLVVRATLVRSARGTATATGCGRSRSRRPDRSRADAARCPGGSTGGLSQCSAASSG